MPTRRLALLAAHIGFRLGRTSERLTRWAVWNGAPIPGAKPWSPVRYPAWSKEKAKIWQAVKDAPSPSSYTPSATLLPDPFPRTLTVAQYYADRFSTPEDLDLMREGCRIWDSL